MPAEGLEPTHSCEYWILSPARLPVPPRRRRERSNYEDDGPAQALPISSSGCRLRGGPKISRKIMALRNPDGDRRSTVMFISAGAGSILG